MFHGLMQEVIDGVTEFGSFSIQAVQGNTRTFVVLKSWKGNNPFNICLGTFDRFTQFPFGEMTSLSGFFSCFPSPVHSTAIINLPSHLGKAIDHASGSKTSTICVPVFSFKDLQDVLRAPTSSVFGKADLFGLLDYLVIRMKTAATESWVLDSVHLRIVSICCCLILLYC